MPLIVRSTRLESLADRLGHHLQQGKNPLILDPVVVAHPGMEHWLRLQLASRQSVVMAERFLLPHEFASRLLHGPHPEQPRSPLDQRRSLTWLIQGALTEAAESIDNVMPELPRPPAAPGSREAVLRRYELAGELAGLYEQYSFSRPQWLWQWQRGEEAIGAGSGESGDWSERAQAALWRHLAEHTQDSLSHRAEALMRWEPNPESLPERLHLFALPVLLPFIQQLLLKIIGHTTVHIYDLVPCLHLHDYARRGEEDSRGLAGSVGEQMLGLLGQVAADNQRIFLDLEERAAANAAEPFVEDELPDSADNLWDDSLLGRLQQSIATLESERLEPPAGNDLSLQVHNCHSPLREVQVLRDCLMELFEAKPDLDPSQILVMTPDISRYEPYIQAVFGAAEDTGLHLPWTLSDRPTGRNSPLLQTLLSVLQPDFRRPNLPQVFGLLEQPFIQRRLELDAQSVDSLRRLCAQAGACVNSVGLADGLNEPWSWDRVLGGQLRDYCSGAVQGHETDGERATGGPHFSGIQWISTLYLLVRELYSLGTAFEAAPDPEAWRGLCRRLADLAQPHDELERRDADTFLRTCYAILRDAERAGLKSLTPEILYADLSERLYAEGMERGFLRGSITFCSLLPMRSVPSRVICLMGMQSDVFPRPARPSSLDLTAHRRQPGDRSNRADDLHIFLQTLIAAREHLIITYRGRNPVNEAEIPPTIAVSEILALLDEEHRNRILHNAPLQPFSPNYGKDHLTYATEWLPPQSAR